MAASKIKKVTVELEELDSNKSSDAVERIKSGFIHFKTHKYLYVYFLVPFRMDSVYFIVLLIWIKIHFSPTFNNSVYKVIYLC